MKCCICDKEIDKIHSPSGQMYWEDGHNASPIAKGRCCTFCRNTKVIPAITKKLEEKINKNL